jgi:DUF4097 and DUF4098 domain-containing protein YvlB
LAGPLKVVARATDVSLTSFTDALDLSVDKGDIDLRPGHTPLGSINVRDGAGDVDLSLPQSTGIVLAADTDHGNIQNDLGLTEQSDGRRSHLEGSLGKGASITITTRRGDISVHHGAPVAKPNSQIAQTKSDDEE